jgi:adenylate kinase
MDSGNLVDDETVLGMIRERLAESDAQRGFILDGFPRTLVQAQALDQMLKETGQPLDSVVLLDVDYAELTKRISGRRSCADCGKVFNVFTSPVDESEVCPKTSQPHRIVQRSDDNEAAVAERLKVYDEKTKPLIDYYTEQGLLRSIDAEGEVDEVTARLNGVLHTPAKPASPAPLRKPVRRRRRSVHRPAGLASTARGVRRRVVKRQPAAKAAPKKTSAKKTTLKKAVPKRAVAKKAAAKKKARVVVLAKAKAKAKVAKRAKTKSKAAPAKRAKAKKKVARR